MMRCVSETDTKYNADILKNIFNKVFPKIPLCSTYKIIEKTDLEILNK